MGRSRSRSRSPRRDRRRSRSRDRDRERKQRSHRSDKRSRSRSPGSRSSRRRRSHSPHSHRDKRSHDRHRGHSSRDYDYPPPPAVEEIEYIEIQDGDDVVTIDGDDEPAGEVDMMKLMGFSGFDSTKGKHVEGNDKGTANIIHKRKYRQYMNRRGGFNRPLDFIP